MTFRSLRGSRKYRYQMDDGTTLDGVEVKRTPAYYIAEAASEVPSEGVSVPLGRIEINRDRVVYRQVLSS